MTTSTLSDATPAKPLVAPAVTSASQRTSLLAVVLGHLTVDMQTGSLAVLLPLLLKTFSLDYTGAAAIMSFKNLLH